MAYRETPTKSQIEGTHGWNLNAAVEDSLSEKPHRVWPTPTGQECEHPKAELTKTGRRKSKNGETSHSLNLADTVRMFPTPTATANGPGKNPDNPRGIHQGNALATAVKFFPTPRRSEYKGVGPLGSKSQKHMLDRSYLCAVVQEKGQETGSLSADWTEWLMGYPVGWTDLNNDAPEQYSIKHEPNIPRITNIKKNRVARLKGIGNAIVPQIAEKLFKLLNFS